MIGKPFSGEASRARSGILSLLGIAILATLVLSGCNRKDGGAKGGRDAASAPAAAVDAGGEAPDPDANPSAVPGGSLNIWGGPAPKTLNPWLDWNWFTKELLGLSFESLVDLHPSEDRPYGILAESWETSPDGRTFTFKMTDKARWSDGKQILCGDIQFYYDVIMNPKNLTSLFRVGMDRFGRPECADSLTLRTTAKEDHFMNFWEAGGLIALPRHVWEGKDFNLINWELPVVSGPYMLDEVKKDRSVSMKRRADWWGFSRRFNQHKYNFQTIRWKFMEDQIKALEAFKKGDIDVFPVNRAAIWAEKTDFDQVKKGWVGKTRVFNFNPMGFRGFIINLRRPIFQDAKVREALALLANRKVMNEKFNHNLFFLLNTYFADIYPEKVAPGRPATPFDPLKARALLAEAGWKPGPDGVLAKGGKRFDITISLTTGADMRPINVYVEDLKAVGIRAKVEELSWSTYAKRMDKYEFDLGLAGWGGTRLRDPESMWHSRTAREPSSNNMAGVQDKAVDSLIQVLKTESDMEKRKAIMSRLDDRLNEIRPYVLLWEKDSQWLLWWRKFGTARWIYSRHNDEECVTTYWYADPEMEKDLAEAMKAGKALPPPPAEVRYGK